MAAGSRILDLKEAVEGLVPDGSLLAMTAEMNAVPIAAVRQVIRSGRRDLRLVGLPGAGIAWDLLIGAGCAAEVEVCHISLGTLGHAPNFKRQVEAGRLTVRDNT